MSVWLTIPSARPPAEAEKCLAKWRAQGYKIALWRDKPSVRDDAFLATTALLMHGEYPGYARAVNRLIAEVMKHYPAAEWFVLGGDDTEPDMNHNAVTIAEQCQLHFGGPRQKEYRGLQEVWVPGPGSTFGIMQPTGDRWAKGSIDKIAGSPWIGREFARRMYQGNGPLWPAYTRFFMDQELQDVAIQYGVFQQRPDLIHLHRHYMRRSDDLNAAAFVTDIPPHLVHQEIKWDEEKKIFLARKNARPTPFPGSEPIA